MKEVDLFSHLEEKEEIDETIREVCENEDRFNSKNYFEKCKDAERKKLFEKRSKEKP